MTALEALVLVVGALGLAFIVIATSAVIIGIHQEERRMTLARGGAPTRLALLARRVLGAHFCLLTPDPTADELFAEALSFGPEGQPGELAGLRRARD